MNFDFDFSNIFNRKLSEMAEVRPVYDNNFLHKMVYNDHTIEYQYNKLGYRSKDFGEKDILTLGCSYTFGTGLHVKDTWPSILSDKMNMQYANLAIPGDSMQGQVIKAFQYFKEFDHPKYIFGVFPIARFEMPYVENKMCKKDNWSDGNIENSKLKFIQKCACSINDFDTISKAPHNPNQIMPIEFAIFYNLMFMQILEQYCLSHKIKIFWTIWERDMEDYFQDKLKNKINSNNFFIEKSLFLETLPCHQKYKNEPMFDWAADFNPKNNVKGHWGFHKHIHLAETMHSIAHGII
jgi:hypothetical protein